MNILRWTVSICLVMMMSLGAQAAIASESTQDSARAVIEKIVHGIIDVLEARKDKTRLSEEDREAIRKLVNGHFDYAAMARRSLGLPWKKLDDKERRHFVDVFRDLLEYSYGNRLNEYHGQTVEFRQTEYRGSKARVMTIVKDGPTETPVEYRLHATDSGWKVYDIRIEGASMIRTFHQDFQSMLQGGSYEDLLRSLEEKVSKLKARDTA